MQLTTRNEMQAFRGLRVRHLATLGGIIFAFGVAVGLALAPAGPQEAVPGVASAVPPAVPRAVAEATHWELDVLGAEARPLGVTREAGLDWELDILGAVVPAVLPLPEPVAAEVQPFPTYPLDPSWQYLLQLYEELARSAVGGGSAVISDGRDTEFLLDPPLPVLVEMYEALR